MTVVSSRQVIQRFDRAAGYDQAASVQRVTARHLALEIRKNCEVVGLKPERILEFGCGTGLLTQHLLEFWPEARIVATDAAPGMLERARERCGDAAHFALLDIEAPTFSPEIDGPFDLICGSLVLQWITARRDVLACLSSRLAPGGFLAVTTLCEDTFAEWRLACQQENAPVSLHDYPSLKNLEREIPAGMSGKWVENVLVEAGSGLHFLRRLKETGAAEPRSGSRPLHPGVLRRVLGRFDGMGGDISWHIGMAVLRRASRAGVFVTGTDTGVGKTFVSACLVRAWEGLYWKPFQTGLSEEEGDTSSVRYLSEMSDERIFESFARFQAPLSPEDAAAAENATVELQDLKLPLAEPQTPLVVEGAGGVLVPLNGQTMIVDVMADLGLPAVLVARSGLGTINHTLLSLEALRARGVSVAGVVLNGPLNAGNRDAIERHGNVRVLAEIEPCQEVTPESVAREALKLPSWAELCAAQM
ncbi:MAG: dethiobiotin synthase [Acetobacter sp.]|nr:dethiobiotin synthase [Acetobacter sp.]